ncbi:MAG: hypothetical protein JO280_08250 [Mycobacteriaceae bacterium]|nr:hypothetical protein [Mycobacteriaceae bacterium]
MATHEARRATWARRMIGAALAAGALAVAGPAGAVMADPLPGPGGVDNPAIAQYAQTIRDLTAQYTRAAQAGNLNQQQFTDDLTAANNQLRDALLAATPAGR